MVGKRPFLSKLTVKASLLGAVLGYFFGVGQYFFYLLAYYSIYAVLGIVANSVMGFLIGLAISNSLVFITPKANTLSFRFKVAFISVVTGSTVGIVGFFFIYLPLLHSVDVTLIYILPLVLVIVFNCIFFSQVLLKEYFNVPYAEK